MLLMVVLIAVVMTDGVFLRPSNLMGLAARASILGIIAFGQALVVISGGFDLSVGSLVAFAITIMVVINQAAGLLAATLAGIVATTMLGAINGTLIAKTHIPPFIVTMGMMSAARSASWLIIGGQDIVFYYFKDLIQPLFANIPGGPNILPILLLGLAFIGALLLLHKSTFGRYLYAIGGNEKAAVVAGIPVAKTKILVYTLSAFMCSIAAIVYLYRVCSASPAMGEEFLLESIAAIAIGGVSIQGGQGSMWGVLIGIFVLVSTTSVLTVAGIRPAVSSAVLGGIILLVILFQQWLKHSPLFVTAKEN
ncbi:MAG: ABC transporter permease [Firmicutes bacterium]|nr:ABC transporter permease [Bacillota bacterium]